MKYSTMIFLLIGLTILMHCTLFIGISLSKVDIYLSFVFGFITLGALIVSMIVATKAVTLESPNGGNWSRVWNRE